MPRLRQLAVDGGERCDFIEQVVLMTTPGFEVTLI